MANQKYELRLNSGLNFYHVASAFQKAIRRGDEHKALWYGTEFYLSNYGGYAWFRMQVMMSEDIGLAEPHLPAQINALYQTYERFKKKKNKHAPEKLPFIHAILLMCRAKKSRIVDNLLCEYMDGDLRAKMPQPEFGDEVFGMHTREGKKMGRGNDFFYEHEAHIENEGLPEEEYIVRDRVWEKYKEIDAASAAAKTKPQPQPATGSPIGEQKAFWDH